MPSPKTHLIFCQAKWADAIQAFKCCIRMQSNVKHMYGSVCPRTCVKKRERVCVGFFNEHIPLPTATQTMRACQP